MNLFKCKYFNAVINNIFQTHFNWAFLTSFGYGLKKKLVRKVKEWMQYENALRKSICLFCHEKSSSRLVASSAIKSEKNFSGIVDSNENGTKKQFILFAG